MNDSKLNAKLQIIVDQTARESTPDRDLWPGIAHALSTPQRTDWSRASALAAAIVLIFGISLYFSAMQSSDVLQNSRIEEYIGELRYEHQQTKQALLVRYGNDQAVYTDWAVQMRELEQAERVIFEALRDDPANLELLKILRQVQAKELELLDAAFAPRLNSI